jgi:hypothetical protein
LFPDAVEDALGRVTLLLRHLLVRSNHLADELQERTQFRLRTIRAVELLRSQILQDLLHRLEMQPRLPVDLPDANPIPQNPRVILMPLLPIP